MEELLAALKKAVSKVDWKEGMENLVEDGILDSIDIIAIVSEITDAFDIEIPSEEMEAENFDSVQAMHEMILRIQDE